MSYRREAKEIQDVVIEERQKGGKDESESNKIIKFGGHLAACPSSPARCTSASPPC